MLRSSHWTILVIAFASLYGVARLLTNSSSAEAAGETQSPPTLEMLFTGQVKVIDLTYSLNSQNAFWPGENYHPFELKTIATLEKDGVLSKAMSLPEHLGTHIDAPNHFESNQPAVDQIPPAQLFGPGVVIDVAPQVELNADYQVSIADIQQWEKSHGRIQPGTIVLVHTGWGRFWKNYDRYKNADIRGKLHFPGFSGEAARFLVEQRSIHGIGIDTLSIDHGISPDFAVHHIVNGAGKYGLENVAMLDKLPARGFYLVIAPIKIETGSGGPTRIFAIIP